MNFHNHRHLNSDAIRKLIRQQGLNPDRPSITADCLRISYVAALEDMNHSDLHYKEHVAQIKHNGTGFFILVDETVAMFCEEPCMKTVTEMFHKLVDEGP